MSHILGTPQPHAKSRLVTPVPTHVEYTNKGDEKLNITESNGVTNIHGVTLVHGSVAFPLNSHVLLPPPQNPNLAGVMYAPQCGSLRILQRGWAREHGKQGFMGSVKNLTFPDKGK